MDPGQRSKPCEISRLHRACATHTLNILSLPHSAGSMWYGTILLMSAQCLRGLVKLKKIKKSEKSRKWVGGSSPNSDFFFWGERFFFF